MREGEYSGRRRQDRQGRSFALEDPQLVWIYPIALQPERIPSDKYVCKVRPGKLYVFSDSERFTATRILRVAKLFVPIRLRPRKKRSVARAHANKLQRGTQPKKNAMNQWPILDPVINHGEQPLKPAQSIKLRCTYRGKQHAERPERSPPGSHESA